MDRIFGRFYLPNKPEVRDVSGTGPGLPIVKGIPNTNAGDVEVRNENSLGRTF